MLLHEMGLPAAVGAEFDALLKYHVDLIRKQSHRPSAYGTFKSRRYDVDGRCVVDPLAAEEDCLSDDREGVEETEGESVEDEAVPAAPPAGVVSTAKEAAEVRSGQANGVH